MSQVFYILSELGKSKKSKKNYQSTIDKFVISGLNLNTTFDFTGITLTNYESNQVEKYKAQLSKALMPKLDSSLEVIEILK